MRQLKSFARFLVIGSSEEYGLVQPNELPIRETNPLRPLSPYAVSKVTQEPDGYQYFKSYDMHIVRARAFNHSGPVEEKRLPPPISRSRSLKWRRGCASPIVHVGDLKPTRDFSDVRDIAAATGRCSSAARRETSTISAPASTGRSSAS